MLLGSSVGAYDTRIVDIPVSFHIQRIDSDDIIINTTTTRCDIICKVCDKSLREHNRVMCDSRGRFFHYNCYQTECHSWDKWVVRNMFDV